MKGRAVHVVLIGLVAGLVVTTASAAPLEPEVGYRLVGDLFSPDRSVRKSARRQLVAADDPRIAPALMETVFFSRHGKNDAIAILEKLLDVRAGEHYHDWVAEIGRRTDLEPLPGYLAFKANQYIRIDPAYAAWFDDRVAMTIRPEEILSGGVRKDGIPALRQPQKIGVEEADYLRDRETVFGAVIEGEAIAWPQRILDWHEMANDSIGGRTVTLSYCTLCRAAILFDTTLGDGETYTFGTSGLLYRSNKLMYDHQTGSLWSNLTGKPVVGPLVGRGRRLPILPLSTTTWGEWRRRHPTTRVLSLDTGHQRDYRPGAAYGRYFESKHLMFPVWTETPDRLDDKDLVFAVDLDGSRKAWSVDELIDVGLLNDRLDDTRIVLLADRKSEEVRAWAAGEATFSRTGPGRLLDRTSGREFVVGDEELRSDDGTTRLPRLPGHLAYWFAWFAFHPDAEFWPPTGP